MRPLFVTLVLISLAGISSGGTLTTPSYKITIDVRCPEGHVTCEDVKYIGISRTSGKSISLTGRTVHTTSADGVTPSRFLGYSFTNGNTAYFVSDDGELKVTQGSNVLVQERGVWKW